jgi:hypothetical protein
MNWLTAQCLEDGTVYWWGAEGFQRDGTLCHILSDNEAKDIISRLDTTKWVGAYVIALDEMNQPIRREAIREAIRADGPTTGPTPKATSLGLRREAVFLASALGQSQKSKA